MKLEIIKASKDHIESIHRITQAAFAKYVANMDSTQKIAALDETYEIIKNDLKSKTILLAMVDGKPAGSIRYQILQDELVYISRFGVDPECHNSGIGRALMLEVEIQAKAKGIKIIVLHTASKMANIIRFYYGLGYYIHSTSNKRGYIRALLCKDLVDNHGINLDNIEV